MRAAGQPEPGRGWERGWERVDRVPVVERVVLYRAAALAAGCWLLGADELLSRMAEQGVVKTDAARTQLSQQALRRSLLHFHRRTRQCSAAVAPAFTLCCLALCPVEQLLGGA